MSEGVEGKGPAGSQSADAYQDWWSRRIRVLREGEAWDDDERYDDEEMFDDEETLDDEEMLDEDWFDDGEDDEGSWFWEETH